MEQGRRVVAIKPVETGCTHLITAEEDGAQLASATSQASPRAALCRLAAPLAPAMAAEAAGVTIDLDELVLEMESHGAAADIVLMEGAGGLLTPITWEWNIVDLARALDASALVVSSDRLGAINQTLLALSALRLARLEVRGVALTAPAEPDQSTGSNAAAIARLLGLDRVARLPREADPFAAVASFADVAGWVLA
jgi:dethiobiotin synthetase